MWKNQASNDITMVLNVFINYEVMFGKVICGGLRQKRYALPFNGIPMPYL